MFGGRSPLKRASESCFLFFKGGWFTFHVLRSLHPIYALQKSRKHDFSSRILLRLGRYNLFFLNPSFLHVMGWAFLLWYSSTLFPSSLVQQYTFLSYMAPRDYVSNEPKVLQSTNNEICYQWPYNGSEKATIESLAQ